METRVMAGNGCLGAGFKLSSLKRGITLRPHVIACDAGSTDSGPSALGSGRPKLSREACKRDLGLLLQARDELKVPLVIGSCGTSGRDAGVDWMTEIALELAKEQGLGFRLATIRSDQDAAWLKRRYREGRVRTLNPAPAIDETVFDSPVVGMMGTEPILAALDGGAEVVLAGRASDSALFAAVPLARSAHAGLAWHAAKTLECGAACAVVPAADGMIATIRDDHFDIEPLDPDAQCTPLSIAAHTLYENANPYLLTEPGGVIDTEHASYEAIDGRSVRVRGSRFLPSEKYTIKLEGARLKGYQTVIMGGMRDPHIIEMLPALLERASAYFDDRIADLFKGELRRGDYDIEYRLYGVDGVMGQLEPLRNAAGRHEIGILIVVTAPTQDLASKIATLVAHVSAHLPVPGYQGIVSTIAYPFSPPEIARGALYEFTLNHVVEPDYPLEMFRTTFMDVRS
jgi:hypothetical protein